MSKFGNGLGVGKCPAPGQCKICKCATPGTDKAGKCPAVVRGGGWAQVELTDAVQKRQTGSLFKLSIIHEWNLDLPGLTVILPSETYELF